MWVQGRPESSSSKKKLVFYVKVYFCLESIRLLCLSRSVYIYIYIYICIYVYIYIFIYRERDRERKVQNVKDKL